MPASNHKKPQSSPSITAAQKGMNPGPGLLKLPMGMRADCQVTPAAMIRQIMPPIRSTRFMERSLFLLFLNSRDIDQLFPPLGL